MSGYAQLTQGQRYQMEALLKTGHNQKVLHVVSKLALRVGASVPLDPILTCDEFTSETIEELLQPAGTETRKCCTS